MHSKVNSIPFKIIKYIEKENKPFSHTSSHSSMILLNVFHI